MLAVPMVVSYKVAPLTYSIIMTFRLLKTPHIALPNLLTDQPMVPEITQNDATPDALATAIADLLLDEERLADISACFSTLRQQLAKGADRLAANAVLELAAQRPG